MSERDHEPPGDVQDQTFTDERGVTLTRAGVDRAGVRLAETRARHTPEYFAELRKRLGVTPRPA